MISGVHRSIVNFKANYDLVDKNTYDSFVKKNNADIIQGRTRLGPSKPIIADGIETGYKISLSKTAKSIGFIMCNGLCFSNGDKVIINHINPKRKTGNYLKDINKMAADDYNEISKQNKPIDLLITGGQSWHENSVALGKQLSNKAKTLQSDNTILWGLRNWHTLSIAYLGDTDTYLMHIPNFDLSKIKSIKDVGEKCFEQMELGKRAKLFVMGKRIF